MLPTSRWRTLDVGRSFQRWAVARLLYPAIPTQLTLASQFVSFFNVAFRRMHPLVCEGQRGVEVRRGYD